MKRHTLLSILVSACAIGGIDAVLASDLPKTQPKMITIWREEVKPGRAAAHAKNEAGYVAAFEKAKDPYHYLGLVSITGPSEAWYISPWESHAQLGESMKFEEQDKGLSSRLEQLGEKDSEYLNKLSVIQASARPDLSFGPFPDLAKARYFQIVVYRVRPGHEDKLEAAVKAYQAARSRTAPNVGFRAYQVIAGMPAGTFLVISSVEKYADFDQTTALHEATLKAQTPEEKAARLKFQTEGLLSAEVNRFRLDPTQSYVSKETRATDPAFWLAK
jgi:hypothetical protein